MEASNSNPFVLALTQVWRTRLCINDSTDAESLGQSMYFIPLAALLLGMMLTTIAWLLSGLPAEVTAAVLMLAWILLSGTNNFVALSQVAHAIVGQEKPSVEAISVSSSSSMNSVGAVVLVLLMILKWALLTKVLAEEWYLVLTLMPLVGWTFGQMIFLGSRWVDQQSLPHGWRDYVSVSWLWPQWLLLLTSLALTSGWTLFMLVIGTWAWIVWWRKLIKGITLAVALSWIEISEMIWLLGLVMVLS